MNHLDSNLLYFLKCYKCCQQKVLLYMQEKKMTTLFKDLLLKLQFVGGKQFQLLCVIKMALCLKPVSEH